MASVGVIARGRDALATSGPNNLHCTAQGAITFGGNAVCAVLSSAKWPDRTRILHLAEDIAYHVGKPRAFTKGR